VTPFSLHEELFPTFRGKGNEVKRFIQNQFLLFLHPLKCYQIVKGKFFSVSRLILNLLSIHLSDCGTLFSRDARFYFSNSQQAQGGRNHEKGHACPIRYFSVIRLCNDKGRTFCTDNLWCHRLSARRNKNNKYPKGLFVHLLFSRMSG